MSTRNPFEAPEVTSRRGGRTKQPLSREGIVSAALDLLARDGTEGMSLRRVAAALDTGAATLYAYVEDLQELQALVLDKALGDVQTKTSTRREWRYRLVAVLKSYFTVLSQTPGLAQLGMNTIATGPNAIRIIETLLGFMDEAGVAPETAAWAVDLLLLYVTSIAVEVSHRLPSPDPLAPIARALGTVSATEFPRVFALREQLLSGDGPTRFDWAIEVLLSGILQTPRAAPARPSRKSGREH